MVGQEEFLTRDQLKKALKKTCIELEQTKTDLLGAEADLLLANTNLVQAKRRLLHAGGFLHNLLIEKLDRGWPFVSRKKIKTKILKILKHINNS